MKGNEDVQYIKESHLQITALRCTRLDFSTPLDGNISFIPSSNVMIWGGETKGNK
jgi:hypothetical protein